MKESNWNIDQIPDLTGKLVVITGCSSGIGREVLKVLLTKNAEVVLACKDPRNFYNQLSSLQQKKTHAITPLDLADLNSVQNFAEEFNKRFDQLALLINNAGVMAIPFTRTKQNIEAHFGINHLDILH